MADENRHNRKLANQMPISFNSSTLSVLSNLLRDLLSDKGKGRSRIPLFLIGAPITYHPE